MKTKSVNKLKEYIEDHEYEEAGLTLILDDAKQHHYRFELINWEDREVTTFLLTDVLDKDGGDVPCDILNTEYTLQDILDFSSQDDIASAYIDVFYDNGREESFGTGEGYDD